MNNFRNSNSVFSVPSMNERKKETFPLDTKMRPCTMQPHSLHFRITIGSFHCSKITETEMNFTFEQKRGFAQTFLICIGSKFVKIKRNFYTFSRSNSFDMAYRNIAESNRAFVMQFTICSIFHRKIQLHIE